MLEVCRLACVRGDKSLYQDLSFTLKPGELLQLFAPNGGGKSSLLRQLCGLLPTSKKKIYWQSKDVTESPIVFKQSMIYIGHKNNLQLLLSPSDNLKFLATVSGASIPTETELNEALKTVGLSAVKHLPCQELSAGQRQRASLARLLLKPVPLWILDEPFSALDKQGKEMLTQMLKTHADNGGLAIVATHQAVQISQTCVKTLELPTYEAA